MGVYRASRMTINEALSEAMHSNCVIVLHDVFCVTSNICLRKYLSRHY